MSRPVLVERPAAHQRIDRELGLRIRQRRVALGFSQTWLGQQIGVSFQQVQKYERGANRVSAASLVAVADALSTTSAALLRGLGEHDAEAYAAMTWACGPDGEAAYTALRGLSRQSFEAVISTAQAIGALADRRA